MKNQSQRRAFEAMGTTIELVVWGIDSERAESVFHTVRSLAGRWENSFSRFIPASELNHINRSDGARTRVSREFFSVVAAAREGYISTGGRFDPTIIDALERAGYDRTFKEVQGESVFLSPDPGVSLLSRFSMLDIEFDEDTSTLRLPAGMRLDLGGIAKGAFVDSVNYLMSTVPGAILNAGGDLRAWGHPEGSSFWTIGVQHPGSLDQDIVQLRLPAGERIAVATSSTRSRTWLAGSQRQNHIIDPATLLAVPHSTPSITVVANTATSAEIEAKAILISIARGEHVPDASAEIVLLTYEDGHYETITPFASAA